MLHRIVMVGLVVVGLVVAGLGVASATVWRPGDTAVMTTGSQTGATLLTTAPGVLSLVDQDVTVTARSSAEAKVVLALGSQVDVDGWVGADPSLRVTGASDWETLTVESLPGAADDPTADAAADAPADPAADPAATADQTETVDPATPAAPGPDPEGSDMWVESVSGTGTASLTWDAGSTDQVLLVAAVGEGATTPQLTLSWPREVTTPLLWPGVALGVLLVVLGLVYGFVTRNRRSSAPAASGRLSPTTSATVTAPPATGTLTRRQLRELAEQEQAAAEAEKAEKAPRQKRQWPWTGAIPVVQAAEPRPAEEETAAPAPEPHRPAWLPEGTASTSGSSWRAAWGVSTPVAGTDSPAGPAATGPTATGSTPAGTAPAATQRPAPVASSDRQVPPRLAETPRPSETPRPPATPRPTPGSSSPVAKPAAPAVPPARTVDQTSPFQRITLRSGEESAPARRLRRDQHTPSSPASWSASRSPWAHEARPATGATPQTPESPAPSSTDDTTKEND